LLVGPSAPDIGSNPYLIRWSQSAGDVVTVGRYVVKDHLDQIAWRSRFFVMDGGDTPDYFSLLDWR
jgi:hypothetical protein